MAPTISQRATYLQEKHKEGPELQHMGGNADGNFMKQP